MCCCSTKMTVLLLKKGGPGPVSRTNQSKAWRKICMLRAIVNPFTSFQGTEKVLNGRPLFIEKLYCRTTSLKSQLQRTVHPKYSRQDFQHKPTSRMRTIITQTPPCPTVKPQFPLIMSVKCLRNIDTGICLKPLVRRRGARIRNYLM